MNRRAVPLHPSIVKRAMPNGRPAGLPKRRPYGGVKGPESAVEDLKARVQPS